VDRIGGSNGGGGGDLPHHVGNFVENPYLSKNLYFYEITPKKSSFFVCRMFCFLHPNNAKVQMRREFAQSQTFFTFLF
jgi:hypothetical protein